ncbi:unnamed protein product [Caenorhabditis auriculariae]|uniref:Uncharacterized protein n=1 Tax=Caenorhabditis auriculariae TaxID=2777116 RepID=A0A8S1HKZ6_9PELO|nr:unnamed protein product [Caenorhabditis auriculariae]
MTDTEKGAWLIDMVGGGHAHGGMAPFEPRAGHPPTCFTYIRAPVCILRWSALRSPPEKTSSYFYSSYSRLSICFDIPRILYISLH